MKYDSSFFCLFRLRLQGSAPGPDVKQVEIWNSVCVCVCVYECVLLCVFFLPGSLNAMCYLLFIENKII